MGITTYADKLAKRLRKFIKRHISSKGYEVDVIITKKEAGAELGISDDGSTSNIIFSASSKIIVTSQEVNQFSMELGDNSEDILEFIWLPPDNLWEFPMIDEGTNVMYLGNDYIVTSASPAALGGNLVIIECRAKKRM